MRIHSDNPIMKIKSRLRLIVVPVILFVIGGCGIVPFIFVQRLIRDLSASTLSRTVTILN